MTIENDEKDRRQDGIRDATVNAIVLVAFGILVAISLWCFRGY